MPLDIDLCSSKRRWQNNRSLFCHTFHTHLISHHAIFFLSPLERKATWALILVGWGDRHCHKGSCTGPSCKYLSAVFWTTIPTLTDLHSGQRQLFWGRMWIYVNVYEYLVIWCDKTTVHEIIDCSSIFAWIAVMKFPHLRANKTPSVLMLPAWHVFMFIPEASLVMHGEDCDIEVMQHCLLCWIWGSDSGGYEDYDHLGCYAV
jgi:hypothetical protein